MIRLKFQVTKISPVDETIEISSLPPTVKLLNLAGRKLSFLMPNLAISLVFKASLIGVGFYLRMFASKPVLPLLHIVGIANK